MKISTENKAKLACLYAGAVWGLFWIPLRSLEDAGLNGLWVTVVYFLVPTFCLVPIGIWRWKHFKAGGFQLQITAMLSGLAILLYAMSIVFTDVVHAILLFYLTPIWGTILARIFLGEAITPQRILAMAVAVVGALTIFGLGLQFPIPQNAGDWLGVAAGMLWAIASLRINIHKDFSAIEMTLGFFFWSLIFSIIVALIFAPSYIPSVAQTLPALPLLLIFMVLLILPGTYASLWGPKFLSPGVVGLLFMTEIVVGSISVALLSAEPLGVREVIGILLITCASLIEPVSSLIRRKPLECPD
ncbi:DMT family transporter [Alphaproteobacteria bacterium]|nr:DMT family transporter [Alphaproteobacteria bacterium]